MLLLTFTNFAVTDVARLFILDLGFPALPDELTLVWILILNIFTIFSHIMLPLVDR